MQNRPRQTAKFKLAEPKKKSKFAQIFLNAGDINKAKEYVKNDKGEITKVNYKVDEYKYGTFNSSGEVIFDKQERPLYRYYYVTSGEKLFYYLYNENDDLVQCFNFGGMPYGGLDEKGDIAIGGELEVFFFER